MLIFKKTKSLVQEIGVLTVICFVALSANLAFGAWTNPPANPPAGNVAAPLNVSTSGQVKNGALDLTALKLTAGRPSIYLHDTNVGDLDARISVNADQIFFQHNTNDSLSSPSWSNALVLNDAASGGIDYGVFKNQVRANEYCDKDGNNCIQTSDVGNPALSRVVEDCNLTSRVGSYDVSCDAQCPAGYSAIIGTVSYRQGHCDGGGQSAWLGTMSYSGRNAKGQVIFTPADRGDLVLCSVRTEALCMRN